MTLALLTAAKNPDATRRRICYQPVALVDFLLRASSTPLYAKNLDYRAPADLWSERSLQGIKIHFREFLFVPKGFNTQEPAHAGEL
jgi:hypothetical protein